MASTTSATRSNGNIWDEDFQTVLSKLDTTPDLRRLPHRPSIRAACKGLDFDLCQAVNLRLKIAFDLACQEAAAAMFRGAWELACETLGSDPFKVIEERIQTCASLAVTHPDNPVHARSVRAYEDLLDWLRQKFDRKS